MAAFSKRGVWHPRWLTLVSLEAPLHALYLRFGDGKAVAAVRGVPVAVLLLLRVGLEYALRREPIFGCLAPWALGVNLALAPVLLYSCTNPFVNRVRCCSDGVVNPNPNNNNPNPNPDPKP